MQHGKEAIIKCCWLTAIFTLGCCVFGSLWGGLYALGDVWGATLSQGVFWGFLISWALNGVALVGLITAKTLQPAPAPHSQQTTDN